MSTDQDQSAGGERERVVQQERADARERVRVAQEREAGARGVGKREARERGQRAYEQHRHVAAQGATTTSAASDGPDEPPRPGPDVPDAGRDDVTA